MRYVIETTSTNFTLPRNNYSSQMDPNPKDKPVDNKIFLNVDHLKTGNYELKILLDNKVIKTVKIKKY